MKTIHAVTFQDSNEKGKQNFIIIECDDLVAVSRAILTHKPKRGYETDKITVVKKNALF